jgi:glutamate formiminotransferase
MPSHNGAHACVGAVDVVAVIPIEGVTMVAHVFDAVRIEAAHHGAAVVDSGIVGLIPAAALDGTSPAALLLAGFTTSQILENRIRQL